MRNEHEQKKLYESLLDAFRRLGKVSYAGAAKLAGCNERTAKKLYEDGYPRLPDCPPIGKALAEDKVGRQAARADALRREEDARLAQREKARTYLQEVEETEDKILRGVRAEVLALTRVMGEQIPAMVQFAKVVASAVIDPATGAPMPLAQVKVTPKEAQGHIRTYMNSMAKLKEMAVTLRQLGRTERGEANVIVKHQDDIPEEIAAAELEALHDYVQRERERAKGTITVVGEAVFPTVAALPPEGGADKGELVGELLDEDEEIEEGEGDGVREDGEEGEGTSPPSGQM